METTWRMPNKNYQKRLRKEYKIVNEYRAKGFEIVQRSAGSHSPIDVFAINIEEGIIEFIQSKPKSMSDKKKRELEFKYIGLNKSFVCRFRVV